MAAARPAQLHSLHSERRKALRGLQELGKQAADRAEESSGATCVPRQERLQGIRGRGGSGSRGNVEGGRDCPLAEPQRASDPRDFALNPGSRPGRFAIEKQTVCLDTAGVLTMAPAVRV